MKTIVTIAAMVIFSIATANAQRHNDNRHNNGNRGDRNNRSEMRGTPQHNDGGKFGRKDKIHDFRPATGQHRPEANRPASRPHNPTPAPVQRHDPRHHHAHGNGPILVREHLHYHAVPAVHGAFYTRHYLPIGYVSTKLLINIPNISSYDYRLSVSMPSYIRVVNEYRAFGEHNYVRDADLALEMIETGVDNIGRPTYAVALIDLHAYDHNIVASWDVSNMHVDLRWAIERTLDDNRYEIARIVKEWDIRHMQYI